MFGHPKGLRVLFFTELWERLSYYGMRAILTLFLVASVEDGGHGMTTEKAGAIYGLYTAFVYLIALPGGWIADRLLGLRRTVFVGGCIIAAGHFSMAVPTTTTFYLGLIFIVIGTGFLKPNISAMVGDLYPEGGARRDAGYSIYYMGINIGAFIGPLICGFLGEKVGWHWGFGAAGVGMVLGVIQYQMDQKALGNAGEREIKGETQAQAKGLLMRVLGGIAVVSGIVGGLLAANIISLPIERVAKSTGVFIVAIAVLYFFRLLVSSEFNQVEKKRIWVIVVLFFSSAIFWGGFEQAGSSMNLFAERLTDLTVGSSELPASWLQSVNPLFIIILAPIVGWIWLALKDRQPSIPAKFAIALLLLATGFFVVAWGAVNASETNKVSPAWLICAYFFHTAGELCLSPVGLSSVTKLAPRRLVGQMMGAWFTATALGNLLAGLFGGMFDSLPIPKLFTGVALLAVGAAFVLAAITKPVKKLIGNIE